MEVEVRSLQSTCFTIRRSHGSHRAERFKTSLQFIPLPYKHLYATLDACKAADYVVFALSPNVEVDTWGDTLLRTLQAQGLPGVVTVVSSSAPLDPKEKSGILKSLLSFIQYFVPSQSRVFDLQSNSDALNTARALCEGKPGGVKWREGRPWLLGEKIEWQDGILSVTGVVRGSPLSANRLVHLPNYGDFQVSKVSIPICSHVTTNITHTIISGYVGSSITTLETWCRRRDGSRTYTAGRARNVLCRFACFQ